MMASIFSDYSKYSEDSSSPRRHPAWYFEDGNCIFLVESTLFNLHRFILAKHSLVFRALFELPPPRSCRRGKNYHKEDEQLLEGLDDRHPILLNGVKVADMEPFLTILYLPLSALLNRMLLHLTDYRIYETDDSLSLLQWISVLDLANRYDFAAICTHAILRLDRHSSDIFPTILRLSLALKYDLSQPSWLLRPLCALVSRKEPLAAQDASMLGIEVAVLVMQAREEVRAVQEVDDEWCACCEQCGKTSALEEDDVETVVVEVFGLTEAECVEPHS